MALALSGSLSLECPKFEGECTDNAIIAFIVCVAVTEQLTGYAWDCVDNFDKINPLYKNSLYRNWFTTALCQGVEFAVLLLYKGYSPPWIAYTVTWSAFGFWALSRLYIDKHYNTGKYKGYAISISELGYSLLSTAAKVSLFGTILAETQ